MHYPLAIYHGHFQREVADWRETPPDPKLPPADVANIAKYCPNGHEGELCDKYGYERMQQEYGYAFYKEWTGPDFPRVIMVTIQHANPYYDDSYAVNSENLGPYGDAITYELIPVHREARSAASARGRARVYGGSTGGWEALASQVFYPDRYNGAWANCPDPIDFRSYTVVDIYADKNAYFSEGRSGARRDPGSATISARRASTIEQTNLHGARARHQVTIRRPVGHLGGRVLAGRRRRLSAAHLGQADWRDRQDGRGLLARALRSRPHHAARLGDARPEAARQDHAQRRPARTTSS